MFKIIFSIFLMAGFVVCGVALATCPDATKCIEFSGASITENCTPKKSNDCNIKDATVVQDKELTLLWQRLSIRIDNLPLGSWYKVQESTGAVYRLTLYPNVGEHYMLGSHDFEVVIEISKINRPDSALTCSVVPASSDFGDVKLQNANFDIQVMKRLNYYYDGGPGGNPNPFTSEVEKIFKQVFAGIKIGKCK